jgi:GT2 family glycosyltransferase
MALEPARDLGSGARGYQVTGPHPEFRLHSPQAALPSGWVTISYRWHGDTSPHRLRLLTETDTSPPESYLLPACHTSVPMTLHLPSRVDAMRLTPPASVRHFELDSLDITELGALQMLLELLRPYRSAVLREPGMAWHFLRRGFEVLRSHGFRELRATLILRFTHRPEQLYGEWVRRYDTATTRDETAAREQLTRLRVRPTFTIIVPLAPGQVAESAPAIRSLREQWYPDWQLLVVEPAGASTRSAAINDALAQATGAFCGVVEAEAELAQHALYALAVECNAHPDAALIYSDEDRIDGRGQRHTPVFKPDWNPDLLCSQPYIGQLTVYRSDVLRAVGGWRSGCDGLDEWDVALRASAALPEKCIRHVPHVLYHRRVDDACTRSNAARRLLDEHFHRLGLAAEVSETDHGALRIRYTVRTPPPLVSIIVPTHNGGHWLQRCLTGLQEHTDYPSYEILVVDNRSDDAATVAYLRELEAVPHVRVLRFDQPFNFSALNNFAVTQARGAVLALLNDDMDVITPDWLTEMAGHALRPEVGAVGAKLYYPDGRIQHAGVILGLGKLAGHAHRGMPEPDPGPQARTFLVHNVSAVTAACLALRTEIYREVGGLDVDLPVAYGDVDLCLRLGQRGYRVVWTPHAQLYHWESATRGLDHSVEKVKRLRREQMRMLQRWGDTLDSDPAYNPNLTLAAPGFALAFPPRVKRPWQVAS